jgi:hypothetical protein
LSLFGPNVLLSTFLPYCQRPCCTPIENHMQNYSFLYPNIYVFSRPEDKCQKPNLF